MQAQQQRSAITHHPPHRPSVLQPNHSQLPPAFAVICRALSPVHLLLTLRIFVLLLACLAAFLDVLLPLPLDLLRAPRPLVDGSLTLLESRWGVRREGGSARKYDHSKHETRKQGQVAARTWGKEGSNRSPQHVAGGCRPDAGAQGLAGALALLGGWLPALPLPAQPR